jgi:hypothetical protein
MPHAMGKPVFQKPMFFFFSIHCRMWIFPLQSAPRSFNMPGKASKKSWKQTHIHANATENSLL